MKYFLLICSLAAVALWWRILNVESHGIRLAAPSGVAVALISGPLGRTLVAGGHDPLATSTWLGRSLPFYVRHLDALVVTDFRKLAAGSVPELLKRYRVGHLMVPTVAKRTALSQQIRALAWKYGTPLISVSTPLELHDGLHRIRLLPVLEEGRLLVVVDGPSGSLVLAHAEDAAFTQPLSPSRLVYRELPSTQPPEGTALLILPGPMPGRQDIADLSLSPIDLP
jgi:hypothetical protein